MLAAADGGGKATSKPSHTRSSSFDERMIGGGVAAIFGARNARRKGERISPRIMPKDEAERKAEAKAAKAEARAQAKAEADARKQSH